MSIGYKAEATSANLNAAFISKTVTDTAVGNIDFQGDIKTDVIAESTAAAGVTVDGVLIKDGLVDSVDVSAHAADSTIHFTEASIDHTAITNIGVTSHADIDTHIADTGLHLTQVGQTFTGKKTFSNGAVFEQILQLAEVVDASVTGTDAVVAPDSPIVQLTDGSLVSIGTISDAAAGVSFILVNRTGNAVTVKNNATGVATERILTGTGADLELADDASLWLTYDSTETRWQVVGGSGAGGGVKIDTYANLVALARTEGKLYYASDLNRYLMDDGTNLNTLPLHDGDKNYLVLGNAETANPWVMYDDAAAIPVDGTGGSTSATITQSATNPLTGTKSFIFTPHSALGEGAAYSFTLDREDKYKLIHCDLSYEVASGTYASGDLAVYLYDVTNAKLLTPFSTHLLANVSIPSTQRFTFQATDSTSYRLLIHQVTTNSSYTMKFEAKLGPKDFAGYATIETDWTDFPSVAAGTLWTGTTTNPSYGTIVTNKAKYRRDGQFLDISYTFEQNSSGGAGSGAYLFNIPASIGVIDTTQVTVCSIAPTATGIPWGGTVVGHGVLAITSLGDTNYNADLTVMVNSSSTLAFRSEGASQNGRGYPFSSSNANNFGSSALTVSLFARVPIVGWSSTAPLISSYDGRVVAAQVTGAAGSYGSGAIIIFPTVTFDTHAAYNVSTGRFTAPVAGYYKVYGNWFGTANSDAYDIYVNGSFVCHAGISTTTGLTWISGSVKVNAGDLIDLRPYSTTTNISTALNSITFELASGAQQIQAGHLVAASYWRTASASVTADTPINFDSRDFETGGSNVTTGASWKFTAPCNGTYSVGGYLGFSAGANLRLFKNGTAYKPIGYDDASSNGSFYGLVELKTGDYIDVRPNNTITVDGNAALNQDGAVININLVGSHLIDQKKILNYEAILMDKQTSGTAGGTAASATWTARNLNTRSSDPDNIIVNSSSFTGTGGTNSTVTLGAGTYYVYARSPHYMANRYAKCRLYNATDASVIEVGTNIYNNNGSDECEVRAQFTLASQKDIQLQYWFNSANGGSDLGIAVTSGSDEVHSVMTIRKIS